MAHGYRRFSGPVAVTVVAIVAVRVEDASKVVSERKVPAAVMTVVPTVEVTIAEPSEVIVVLTTVTAVRVTVLSIGTVITD